jgi:hypothetical protein
MAAPITHIALTEKIFDSLFKDKDRKEFFIGTLFPDIRYLNVISRDKTHYTNISVSDLYTDTSFLAGVKFHSIVDKVREQYIINNNIYSLCPKSPYITESLKFLEDEILYPNIQNPISYIEYLEDILSSEIECGINEYDIRKWHTLLQQYLSQKPHKESIAQSLIDTGLKREVANEINQNIDIIKSQDHIISTIKNLYTKFDSLL